MADIGIGIKVGYSEVTAARKNLDGLKQSLEEVAGESEFELSGDGKSFVRVTKEAAQLKKELEGASTASAKIVKDYNALIKLPVPGVFKNTNDGAGRTSISSGTAQDYNDALRRSAEQKQGVKRQTAAEQYFEKHGNYGATVNGKDDEGGQNGGAAAIAGNMMNKMAMVVAGAVTVGTAIAFLQRARTKYTEGAINESGLQMRGITGTGTYLGIGRTEMQQHAAALASQSGYTSNSSLRSSMDFSAATGTDASLAIGVMASSRDLTGGGEETGKRMLKMLKVIADVTKDSPERINKHLDSNYQLFQKAQGGAPLTAAQMLNIQELTAGLRLSGAQGRDASLGGTLKNGFKSTGDPATDILKAQMTGVYDEGPLTFDRMLEIKKRQEQGFYNSKNRDAFRKFQKNPNISRSQLIILAQSFLDGRDTPGVENFLDKTLPGMDKVKFAMKDTGISTDGYQATAGAGVKQRQARKEESQHASGEVIEKAAAPWEQLAYDTVDKIFGSGVPNKIANVAANTAANIKDVQAHPPVVMSKGVQELFITTVSEMLRGSFAPLIDAIIALTKAMLQSPATATAPTSKEKPAGH